MISEHFIEFYYKSVQIQKRKENSHPKNIKILIGNKSEALTYYINSNDVADEGGSEDPLGAFLFT